MCCGAECIEWFDWVFVEFQNSTNDEHTGDIAALLYICMVLCYIGEPISDENVYILVQPLAKIDTPCYPILKCFGYDVLYHKSYVIHCQTSFKGSILVLPAVELDMVNGTHHKR